MASSLAQGGPTRCFLDESVYSLLVNPSVPVHELDPQKHLTPSDRLLLNSVRTDLTSHADTVIEHGYTRRTDDSHMEEIVKSIVISIVTKRVVYLIEFLEGLNAYSLGSIIQTHPEACKSLLKMHGMMMKLMLISCFQHCTQHTHQKAAQGEK